MPPTPRRSSRRSPRRPAARLRPPVAAALLAATLLSACASSEAAAPVAPEPPASPSPSPVVSTAPSQAPSPRPAAPALNPFTGTTVIPRGPVVAVKIDNSPLARPFTRGLGEASLLYEELMEGGATRFLAIFSPATGNEVGPIRSVREGDIELLQQFGKIALGASGGNTGVLATVAKAAQEGKLLDASFDVLPAPYRKGARRKDAINFFTSPEKIDKARPGGSPPQDIGLHFAPLPADAGFPAPSASISFSPISRVKVVYDATGGRYAVFQERDRMREFQPANVIVQHTQIQPSRYVDVLGNATPYTETVGSGPAALLRDGRRVSGTWRRLAPHTGTRFLDDKGRDLPLKPGPTLVLLVPKGTPLRVG